MTTRATSHYQYSAADSQYDPSTILKVAGFICLGWYIVVFCVCVIGIFQLLYRRRYFSSPPTPPKSSSQQPSSVPYVTIIRPVKGIDSQLYDCLASTFLQSYPLDRLVIYFCVSSRSDPAFPLLQQLLSAYPDFNAEILIGDEDPLLRGPNDQSRLGPNPKIRNMSQAYRLAKGDIIWMLDCNVWVDKHAAGRMVDRLEGFDGQGGFKFVHLLPLVVDTSSRNSSEETTRSETTQLLEPIANGDKTHLEKRDASYGARLEELFFSSSHAKFYSAINTVLIAPCIVGKSNMYRKSHLDSLTPCGPTSSPPRDKGLDYFSDFICEDHLVGDMLWKNKVPSEKGLNRKRIGKHSCVFGTLAIQPMAHMSTGEYIARRVRWLRVRKFTVIAATLVEPGTESILCSLYGAFGATVLAPTFALPIFTNHTSNSWLAFLLFLILSLVIWMQVDRYTYLLLHSGASVTPDESNPFFVKGSSIKSYGRWAQAWIGRELLACPIWTWACLCGRRVVWRGQLFSVGLDMRATPCSTDDLVQESRSQVRRGKLRND